MHTLPKSALALTLLFCILCLLTGCNSHHVNKIASIDDNPAAYAHKDVTVVGEVTKLYSFPLGITNIAAYRLNDGSGQIWIISQAGAPAVGDKVGVKGRVHAAGQYDGMDFGVVIQELQRREL
jgi:hypothetical protein